MIFRAPEEPLEIPEVALTPFLMESAERRGDKPALIDAPSGRTLTYRGWVESVRRAAAGLSRRGLRKGDVFAIYSPNLPEYAIAFHAVSLLGGIVTTINPAYTVSELSRQLADARARYLLTTPAFLDKAMQAAGENNLGEVLVFGDSFEALLESNGDVPAVTIDPGNDVVALPYSSGTVSGPRAQRRFRSPSWSASCVVNAAPDLLTSSNASAHFARRCHRKTLNPRHCSVNRSQSRMSVVYCRTRLSISVTSLSCSCAERIIALSLLDRSTVSISCRAALECCLYSSGLASGP